MKDRRIIKSERALLDAYTRLLKEKAPEKITVTALCREANLSRYTFYAHYQDYDQFLDTVAERIIEQLMMIFEENRFDTNQTSMINHLFEYVIEHGEVLYILMERKNGAAFFTLYERLKKRTISGWAKESRLSIEQLELLFTYSMVGGHAMIYHWWKSGMQIDKETVKELYEYVVKYGIYNYVYTI